MRTLTLTLTLTAAAPLALLAACGETTPADQSKPAPMEAEVAELDMASEALPAVPENALDQVDYAGTYTRDGDEGRERLTLNSQDNTYEYSGPDGSVTTGSYTRMDDNRRLAIEDFNGQAAYFSVANGSIYRLTDANTPPDEITVTAQYRRDDSNPAQETGPGATVDNVADRRE